MVCCTYYMNPRPPKEARSHRENSGHLKGAADDSILAQKPQGTEQVIPIVTGRSLKGRHQRQHLCPRVRSVGRDVSEVGSQPEAGDTDREEVTLLIEHHPRDNRADALEKGPELGSKGV